MIGTYKGVTQWGQSHYPKWIASPDRGTGRPGSDLHPDWQEQVGREREGIEVTQLCPGRSVSIYL